MGPNLKNFPPANPFKNIHLKSTILYIIRLILFYLFLSAGIFLMLKIIVAHFSLDSTVGFLQTKQAYVHFPWWRTAFYIHVFTGILTLAAGFTQFSDYFLQHYRKAHRAVGKIYVIAVLVINFPSGIILAFCANGMWHTRLAFIILDTLWFWFTYKALIEAKKKNITAHREFMMRSYALTCSALTLRSWKLILSSITDLDPSVLYMMDAWLGFVPNLLFAEWLIYKQKNLLSAEVKVTEN